MKPATREIVVWTPRVAGLALAVFLGLFAFDSLDNSHGIPAAAISAVMGLLPAMIVLGTVMLGWKYEAIAAAIFTGLAVLYAASALDHPAWIAVIAGPLVLEAALFLLSWWFQSRRWAITSR